MTTPTLDDVTKEDSQRFGRIVKNLEPNDLVRVTNNRWDEYKVGEVVTTHQQDEMYIAVIENLDEGIELQANWRDIPPDSDDQETPYTGALVEPFDDTSPAITDIEVIDEWPRDEWS